MERVAAFLRRRTPMTILLVLIGAMLLTSEWRVSHADTTGISAPRPATTTAKPRKTPNTPPIHTNSDIFCTNNPVICGIVTDSTGAKLPNIKVHVTDSAGNDISGVFQQNPINTNSVGAFIFGDSGTDAVNKIVGTLPLNTPLKLRFEPGANNTAFAPMWWQQKWTAATACAFRFSSAASAPTLDGCGELTNGTRFDQILYRKGVIAGTVTTQADVPIAGIQVDAANAFGVLLGKSAFTDSTGQYIIENLQSSDSPDNAGPYLVRFSDPLNSTYGTQWYNGIRTVDCTNGACGATQVNVSKDDANISSSLNINAKLGDANNISGVVVNNASSTGVPIPGVRVELWSLDANNVPVSFVVATSKDNSSNNPGGFQFDNTDPNAKYKIYLNPGPSIGYMPEWYTPDVGGAGLAANATLVPGNSPPLRIKLDVGGAIAGAVTQDDTSPNPPSPIKPLSGVTIKVFDVTNTPLTDIGSLTPVAFGESGNIDGSYSTPTNLRPGSVYLVQFVPPANASFSATYYQQAATIPNYGTQTATNATLVTVTQGAITTNISVTLPAAKASISGKVLDVGNSALVATQVTIHLYRQTDNATGQNCAAPNITPPTPPATTPSYYARYGDTSSDPIVAVGTTDYTTPKLQLGCYLLAYEPFTTDAAKPGYLTTWYSGSSTPALAVANATPISVQAGGATNKIVNLPFATVIAGVVYNNQGTGAAGVAVSIYSQNSDTATAITTITTADDGSFRSIGLPGGTNAAPIKYYVKATPGSGFSAVWYNGAQRAVDATPIPTSANSLYKIQINLSSTGIITGTVYDANTGLPLSGADVTIYLARDPNGQIGKVTTGADGTYNFNAPPVNRSQPTTSFYTVKFTSPSATQWYNNQTTQSNASQVYVDVGNFRRNVDGTLATTAYGMTGKITDSASPTAPLSNVSVNIYNSTNLAATPIYTTNSDNAGNFSVPPVLSNQTGQNRYCVQYVPPADGSRASHFLPQYWYPPEFTGDRTVRPNPCNIVVNLQAVTANVAMLPRAIIRGQVSGLTPAESVAAKVVAYRVPVTSGATPDFTLVDKQNGSAPTNAGIFSFLLPLSQTNNNLNSYVICAIKGDNSKQVCWTGTIGADTPQQGTPISFTPISNDTKDNVQLNFGTPPDGLAIAPPGPKVNLPTVSSDGNSVSIHINWSAIHLTSGLPFESDYEVQLSDPNSTSLTRTISMSPPNQQKAAMDVIVTGLQPNSAYYYLACSWPHDLGPSAKVCAARSAFSTPVGGNPINIPGAPLRYYFPDGEYSDSVQQTFNLFNPSTSPADTITVQIVYAFDSGNPITRNVSIPPKTRVEVNPADSNTGGVGAEGKGKKFSVTLNSSDNAFVAEVSVSASRPHTNTVAYSGQYSMLLNHSAAADVYFPAVSVSGAQDTLFTIMNTGQQATQDTKLKWEIYPFKAGQAPPSSGKSGTLDLLHGRRVQISLSDIIGKRGSSYVGSFGIKFSTTNSNQPLIVGQQTVYYKAAGGSGVMSVFGANLAGTNTTGFAQSPYNGTSDTSYTLLNTGGLDLDVVVTYTIAPTTSDGVPTIKTATITVPAQTVRTITPGLPPNAAKPEQIGRVGIANTDFASFEHSSGTPTNPSSGLIVMRTLKTTHGFARNIGTVSTPKYARTTITGGSMATGTDVAKRLWFFGGGDTKATIGSAGGKPVFTKADDMSLSFYYPPVASASDVINQATVTYYYLDTRTTPNVWKTATRAILLKPGVAREVNLADPSSSLFDTNNTNEGIGPDMLVGIVINAPLPIYIERGAQTTQIVKGTAQQGISYGYGLGLSPSSN